MLDVTLNGAREVLCPNRLLRAKVSYTTRFVGDQVSKRPFDFGIVVGDQVIPRSGDVVLATVQSLGQHVKLETPNSRQASIFVGDELLAAYGNRYAPDQFEAEVPDSLRQVNLAASGGVVALALTSHHSMLPPTVVQPVGLLTDKGSVVNLKNYAIPLLTEDDHVSIELPRTIAVVGTSMNSGKTTSAAAIIRGLRASGFRVAAGKVTGTGAGGDPNLYRDSGAVKVLDFTDFGYPSTYLLPFEEVHLLLDSMLRELAASDPDVIVIEVADGVYQRETYELLSSEHFKRVFQHCVFASGEAVSAVGGYDSLVRLGLEVSLVTGIVSNSPLAAREASRLLPVSVLSTAELESPALTEVIFPELAQHYNSIVDLSTQPMEILERRTD